jgi:glycine reductase
MAHHVEQAAREIVELLRPFQPDVFVAGPSFGSGRYGLACGQVCTAVQSALGIPAIAGMFEDSPGAEQYRNNVLIVPTRETAAGMGAALAVIARLVIKLGRGEVVNAPEEDGYLPQHGRRNEFASERGAGRAVKLLLAKMRGEKFVTEWPLPRYDRVAPLPPTTKKEGIKVALVTEGGVVPKGNPDRLPSAWATTFARYDISHVLDLTSETFETIHGGFDTTPVNQDPDRMLPVDAMRELEREGKVELLPEFLSTVGNMSSLADMRRVGAAMAQDLLAVGAEAVIVGAT